MKKYKAWLTIVLLLLIINSVALAIIWFRKGEHRHIERPLPLAAPEQGMQQPKDIIIKTLALTLQQQQAYALMVRGHRATTAKLNEANHKLRDSLFNNIKKPVIDSTVINAITKKISDNQAVLEKATLYHFRQLRRILTPVQQTKFDSIINDVLRMMAGPGMRLGQGSGTPPAGMSRMHRHNRMPQHGGMPPPGERMGDGRDMPPPQKANTPK
jgi:Spy/CpxP family protein refolding chaperone